LTAQTNSLRYISNVSASAFTLPSFAKINLSLRILGRRADGYHEVRTVLQTISLQDQVSFTLLDSPVVELTCNDAEIPVGSENLIVRTAEALRRQYVVGKGASIHLEKRIPVKGGLGGGSSNAAMALLGLSHLWKLSISRRELVEIGSRLGADVPFFFTGGRALASGTGTTISPLLDADPNYLIVVTPNVTISTARAYEALKAPALTTSIEDSILSISQAQADLELSHLCSPRNDFEEVIFKLEPEIERAQEALREVGAASSLLAGSGSSVFGIFESEEKQKRAVKDLKAETGWRVFAAVTVSRKEYLQALGSCGLPLVSL
jgi:4-diphosphocytidyl-2-C-methyl-D-erythritol kinase